MLKTMPDVNSPLIHKTSLQRNSNANQEEVPQGAGASASSSTITVQADTASKVVSYQEDSTVVNTMLANRKSTLATENAYSSLIHEVITTQSATNFFYTLDQLKEEYITNTDEINGIVNQSGYHNLFSLLDKVTQKHELSTCLQKEEALGIKEVLLSIIRYCKINRYTLEYCYMAVQQIFFNLQEESSANFYLEKLHKLNQALAYQYKCHLFSCVDPIRNPYAIDVQGLIDCIQQATAHQSKCIQQQMKHKRQEKGFEYFLFGSYPPTYILNMVFNKFYVYIKENDYIITDVELFNKTINDLNSSLFEHSTDHIRVISEPTIEVLLNPKNKDFLKIFTNTPNQDIYDDIKKIIDKYAFAYNPTKITSELNTVINKYNIKVKAEDIGKYLYKQYAGLLFTNIDKATFYKSLELFDTLILGKTNIQQNSTNNIKHQQCIETDQTLATLKNSIQILNKISEIDSLEKLHDSELTSLRNLVRSHIKYINIEYFLYNSLITPSQITEKTKSLFRVYCEIYKLKDIIRASLYSVLVDLNNSNLLLTKHIPFFKHIATTENSQYVGATWFIAGEIAAYCLKYPPTEVKGKDILQDAINSYTKAAELGNHRAYYKIAELILQNSTQEFSKALEFYQKALVAVGHHDEYYFTLYSASIALLDLTIEEQKQEQQSLTTPAKKNKNKKSKAQKKPSEATEQQKDDITVSQPLTETRIKTDSTELNANFDDNPANYKQTELIATTGATFTIVKRAKPPIPERIYFWRHLQLANEAMHKWNLDEASRCLNKMIASSFYQHTDERIIKAMGIQNKVYFYYKTLTIMKCEDIELYFLASDKTSSTPKELSEDILIKKTCGLVLSGLHHLSVNLSEAGLLTEDIDCSHLSEEERRQLASLLSMRAHIYCYQSSRTANRAKYSKFKASARILFNKADMVNPYRLLR